MTKRHLDFLLTQLVYSLTIRLFILTFEFLTQFFLEHSCDFSSIAAFSAQAEVRTCMAYPRIGQVLFALSVDIRPATFQNLTRRATIAIAFMVVAEIGFVKRPALFI